MIASLTQNQPAWHRKDLVSIAALSAAEITQLLDTASAFKDVGTREVKKVPALRGKTLVNFSSSRARARGRRSSSPHSASART